MTENNSIDGVYQEYKIVRAKLDKLQSDYSDGLLKKEALDKELNKGQATLTATLNQIASEKIAWAQEKAEELRKLDEKKDEVNLILKRWTEINQKEAEVSAESLVVTENLRENRTVLLEIQNQKIANDVILKEATKEKEKAENLKKETKETIESFKKDIDTINKKIQKL